MSRSRADSDVEYDADTGKPAFRDVEFGDKSESPTLGNTSHRSMSSSILRFHDITFAVGSGDKKKHILESVSCRIKWGHVLAVLGPSGAGKVR